MTVYLTVTVTVDATCLTRIHGAGQARFLRTRMLNVTMKMTLTSKMTFKMTMNMTFNIKFPRNYHLCDCHSDCCCYMPPLHPQGPPSPLTPRLHAQCHNENVYDLHNYL